MQRRRFVFAGLVSALSFGVLACSSGTTGTTPGSSDGSGDGPSPGGGHCDGYALECYKIDSISSCFRQLGCRHVTDDCTGKQVFCNLNDEKSRCVGQMGCFWVADDGAQTKLPTGTCTGAAVPCKTLTDQATCLEQHGFNGYAACKWDASKKSCDRDFRIFSECGAWNVQIYPDEAQRQCEGRLGCTWVAD